MIQIRKILKELVDSLDYTFYIKSVSVVTGGYRLETCDTLNLCTNKKVIIGGVEYLITDFELNEFIEVEGTTPITASSFVVTPLTFEYGTLLDTNVERAGFKQIQDNRVPFFWLRTPYNYEKGSYEDTIGKTADLTFYLLDEVLLIGEGLSPGDVWYTERHETRIIEPLQNLLEKRIEKYINENQGIFGELPSYSVRGMVLAGVEGSDGFQSTLFDEKLSGIEVRINLEFQRQECNC